MNSASKHKKTMAEELFEQKINNITQSLCKDGKNGIKLYHDFKVDITKRFNSPTSVMLPHEQEGKPVIVVEMSLLIRTKPFATHAESLTNFGWFAVLVYKTYIELRQDRFGFWLILREKSQRRYKI